MHLHSLHQSFVFLAGAGPLGRAIAQMIIYADGRIIAIDANQQTAEALCDLNHGEVVLPYVADPWKTADIVNLSRKLGDLFGSEDGYDHVILTFDRSADPRDAVGWKDRLNLILDHVSPKAASPQVILVLPRDQRSQWFASLVDEIVTLRRKSTGQPYRLHKVYLMPDKELGLKPSLEVRAARIICAALYLFPDHDQELTVTG